MIALFEDIKAIYHNDPAARNVEFLFYAGFWAISLHRLTNLIWRLKIPVLPRIISQLTRFLTGVEIHPGAKIGKGFFIDHGMGVVVGETTEIGENCVLFHNVTLGGTGKHKKKRHPTIEDNVIIYAGCTILGGETRIGHDSVIGGNVWLTESVQPFSVVYQKHNVVARDSKVIPEQINWVI